MTVIPKVLEESVLPRVTKPNRYASPFSPAVSFEEAAARLCLLVPVPYERGLSRFPLRSLFHALERRLALPGAPRVHLDLCFTPQPDLAETLKDRGFGLFALASHHGLRDHDLIVVLAASGLEWLEAARCLTAGGIPAARRERAEEDPLVGALGTTVPVAGAWTDFIGRGDVEAFADTLVEAALARAGSGRGAALAALEAETGIEISGLVPADPRDARILRRTPVTASGARIPISEIDGDALLVDLARASGQGAAFDALGADRFVNPERALREIEESLVATGYSEVLFTGRSAEHPEFVRILEAVNQRFSVHGITGRVRSVGVELVEPALARELSKGRRGRFVLDPVHCSERLRAAAGRPLDDAAILDAVEIVLRGGWPHLVLGVLAGAPGETDEDRAAWTRLMEAVRGLCPKGGGPVRIALEVHPVIEPGAAFAAAARVLESIGRTWRVRLQSGSRFKVALRSPQRAWWESLLTVLGEEAAPLLPAPAGPPGGAGDDGPDPLAAEPALAAHLGPGSGELVSNPVPWDAAPGVLPDPSGMGFGVPSWIRGRRPRRSSRTKPTRRAERYRIRYSKSEPLRFTSHLDIARAFERVFRRSQLPVALSQGKDRRPKVAFGPPLPLGMTSDAEYLDVTLARQVPETFTSAVNDLLPEGLVIAAAAPIRNEAASLSSAIQVAEYQVWFSDTLTREALGGIGFDDLKARLEARVEEVTASSSILVNRVRKDRQQTLNVRPSLLKAEVVRDDGGRPVLKYRLALNRSDSVRPESLTSAVCDWVEFDERLLRVHRSGLFVPGRKGVLDPLQVIQADFAWWRQPVRGGTVV